MVLTTSFTGNRTVSLTNITNATGISNIGAGDIGIWILFIFIIAIFTAAIIFYYFYRGNESKSKNFDTLSGRRKFKITINVSDENKKAVNDAFLLLQKESGDIEFSNRIPSTITIPNLDEGKYSFKVVKDGYSAINQTFNLKTDMNFDIVLTTEKKLAEAKIRGIPEGMFVVEFFVKTPSGIPISNAKISVGGQKGRVEAITNSEGVCTLTLPKGEYLLSAERNLCENLIKHITINGNERIAINLMPTVKITPEQRSRLQAAYSMVLNAYNEIHSGYERTIPKYFVKVAEKVIMEIEKQAENVNFNSKEDYENAINEYIKATEISMKMLANGMLENRNILLYAKLSQYEKEIEPPIFLEIEKLSISEAYRALSEIDNVLIYEIRNISIYPVAVLWKVAKHLLNEPNDASAHIGGIFLKAAEFMLKNDELRKRLRITIL